MEKLNKAVALVVWFAGIYLWIAKGFWYIAVGIFTLHFVEIFIKGIPIGAKAGKSKVYSIIMTLIFGFTWWLPIQKEME